MLLLAKKLGDRKSFLSAVEGMVIFLGIIDVRSMKFAMIPCCCSSIHHHLHILYLSLVAAFNLTPWITSVLVCELFSAVGRCYFTDTKDD